MAVIKLLGFSGIAPKLDPRYLRETQAQTAQNCKLTGGALNSFQSNAFIEALPLQGDVKSIYKFGNYWCQWNNDVDVIRSPVAALADSKIYFSGAGAMRVTDTTLVDSGTKTGVITNATQANPVVITDPDHGLFDSARIYIDSIVGMTELNGRYFTITYIDEDTFSLDNEDGTGHTAYTSGGTWTREANEYPEDSYFAGVPAPTTAPTAALNGTHTTPVNTAYVYTFVNDWGEESAPSPVSNIVAADFSTGSVDLTTMDQTYSGYYNNISKWRIYRIATGTANAEYQFVAEVTINGSSPQYNDSILTSALGEAIVTEGWVLPPSTIKGITSMANGITAGFDGNEILFSEPYIPYAWPTDYRLTVAEEIVGIESFGSSLLVTTKGNPYLVTGIHPSTMALSKIPNRQPCLSKRAITGLETGVMYPCPDGLFYVGQEGYRLITQEHFTREEWDAYSPGTSHAAQYDRKYVIFLTASSSGMIFDPVEFGPVTLSNYATAVYADPETDRLYMAIYDSDNTSTDIYEFNAGGSRLNYTWKSKIFQMPVRQSMSAAKIHADYDAAVTQAEVDAINAERTYLSGLNDAKISGGTVNGAVNSFSVNGQTINGDELFVLPAVPSVSGYVMKVFADGTEIHSVTVTESKPVRIPIDSKYIDYEIELSGEYPIREVFLATSIRELTQGV